MAVGRTRSCLTSLYKSLEKNQNVFYDLVSFRHLFRGSSKIKSKKWKKKYLYCTCTQLSILINFLSSKAIIDNIETIKCVYFGSKCTQMIFNKVLELFKFFSYVHNRLRGLSILCSSFRIFKLETGTLPACLEELEIFL